VTGDKQEVEVESRVDGRRSERLPGVNMTELAKRLDVSLTHLSQVVNGARTPSVPLAKKLAQELKCSVDDVLRIAD
jgi:transcriptional regulator with XRE-family HTH domain